MDLQLDNQRALVLASSAGIGLASARALADHGAQVVISSRNQSNLAAATENIIEKTDAAPEQVDSVVCDLSKPSGVGEQVADAIDNLGGLDILVTNSGGPEKIGFEEASINQFDNTYDTVLKSVLITIKQALPALKNGGGAITNLIAASAQEPAANHVLANTIRIGIYGLSKSLSEEYADQDIRVNCVCPKKVGPLTDRERGRRTHIDRYADENNLSYAKAREEYIGQIIPMGRHGTLAEFGRVVAFLSSPAASYISGHSLNVDGGWTEAVF